MDGALGQSDNQLDVGRKYQCGLGCVVSLSLSLIYTSDGIYGGSRSVLILDRGGHSWHL